MAQPISITKFSSPIDTSNAILLYKLSGSSRIIFSIFFAVIALLLFFQSIINPDIVGFILTISTSLAAIFLIVSGIQIKKLGDQGIIVFSEGIYIKPLFKAFLVFLPWNTIRDIASVNYIASLAPTASDVGTAALWIIPKEKIPFLPFTKIIYFRLQKFGRGKRRKIINTIKETWKIHKDTPTIT